MHQKKPTPSFISRPMSQLALPTWTAWLQQVLEQSGPRWSFRAAVFLVSRLGLVVAEGRGMLLCNSNPNLDWKQACMCADCLAPAARKHNCPSHPISGLTRSCPLDRKGTPLLINPEKHKKWDHCIQLPQPRIHFLLSGKKTGSTQPFFSVERSLGWA